MTSAEAVQRDGKKSSRAYLLLSLVILIWGTSFIGTKQALLEASPMELIAVRFSLAWLTLFLLGSRIPCDGKGFRREHLPLLLLLSLVEPVAYFFFETWALKLTAPAHVAMIVCLSPLFTTLIAQMFLGEKPAWIFYPALMISILGVAISLSSGAVGLQGFRLGAGEALAFGACLIVSVYILIARKLTRHYSSYRITRFQMGFTAIVFFGVLPGGASWSEWSAVTWGCVLGLGVFSSAVAYLCLNSIFDLVPARHIGIGGNLIPLVTLGVGAALPGGHLSWVQLVGIGVALFGLMLALSSERRTC